jgi:hypothetical protein
MFSPPWLLGLNPEFCMKNNLHWHQGAYEKALNTGLSMFQ